METIETERTLFERRRLDESGPELGEARLARHLGHVQMGGRRVQSNDASLLVTLLALLMVLDEEVSGETVLALPLEGGEDDALGDAQALGGRREDLLVELGHTELPSPPAAPPGSLPA